jgi:hypothetical protein
MLVDNLWIRADLANHIVYGMAAYWVGAWYMPVVGLVLATAAALLKDLVWDKKLGKGTYSPLDIAATVALPVAFFLQAHAKDIARWIQ